MVTVLCAATNEEVWAKTSQLILYKINLSLKLLLFFGFFLARKFLTAGKAVEYVYFYVSPEQARGLALPGRMSSSSGKLQKAVLDSQLFSFSLRPQKDVGSQLLAQLRERTLITVTELSSSKVVNSQNSQVRNVARLIGWLNLAKPRLCLTEENRASIYYLNFCCDMRW